jgi:hypothetical protein
MIYRLLEVGTSAEKINEVFSNTDSLATFKDALRALNVELFQTGENSNEL